MSGLFVMVPEWLRRKKPSGNAVLVYVNLAAFGTFSPGTGVYDECRPTLESLAEETGLSESTVRRALAELYGHGALERTPRWDPETKRSLPTVYRVLVGQLVESLSPVTPSHPVTGDTPAEQPTVTGGTLPPVTGGTLQGVTSEQGPRTPNTYKINTRDAREDLDNSPMALVSSGHTKPTEAFGAAIDERVTAIMDGWAANRREHDTYADADRISAARREVRNLVVKAATHPSIDFDTDCRMIFKGLCAWGREAFAAFKIGDFASKASAPPAGASKAGQALTDRRRSLVDSVMRVAERQGITGPGQFAIGGA